MTKTTGCPMCTQAHTEHYQLILSATDEELSRLGRAAHELSGIASALTEPNRLTKDNMRKLAEIAEVHADNYESIVTELRTRAKATKKEKL